jgi:hypothetical protein
MIDLSLDWEGAHITVCIKLKQKKKRDKLKIQPKRKKKLNLPRKNNSINSCQKTLLEGLEFEPRGRVGAPTPSQLVFCTYVYYY